MVVPESPLTGMPLQYVSPARFSEYAVSAYNSPMLDCGVGAYVCSALMAAWPSTRTRFSDRNGPARNVLVGSKLRWSMSLRWTNVSPERYSSASNPP